MAVTFPRNDGATLIAGVGSALVDVLLREDESFVKKWGGEMGGMVLVDSDQIEKMLADSGNHPTMVCGGSACNTIVGVGNLAGQARFIGKRGTDHIGEFFERDLVRHGVEPHLFRSPSPTGRVLSVITPDAQRSMFTCLGASAEAKPEEIRGDILKGAALVHIEGYLLFNEAVIRAALNAAREIGAYVSLDLASFTVVEAARPILKEIVHEYVDILIANEDEARAYTGTTDEAQALTMLSEEAPVAVLKLGKRGSVVATEGRTFVIERHGTGDALDTTGAGDLWASGFLHGLICGHGIEDAGRLGSACGHEVCQVIGAQIPSEGWQRVRQYLPLA